MLFSELGLNTFRLRQYVAHHWKVTHFHSKYTMKETSEQFSFDIKYMNQLGSKSSFRCSDAKKQIETNTNIVYFWHKFINYLISNIEMLTV